MTPRPQLRPPFTPTGWLVAALGLSCWFVGWQLGWIELMVVAAGALVALLVATPFVVGRLQLRVDRTLQPDRVMVGEPALAVLRVTNDTDRRLPSRVVEDRVAERRMQVEVPGLVAGGSSETVYHLPTLVRGTVTVGPAMIVKSDPLGLMRREVVQTRADRLWVHPRHRVVRALPVGWAKDLEGPTSDTSPQGDVAFHTLREYQPGDDYRHIHWLSTARAGTTMVRHYVDNRRPHLGVVLDDRADVWTRDTFEVAVEVAASLTVSSLVHQQPAVLHWGAEVLAGHTGVPSTDDVLDRLTLVGPHEEGTDLGAATQHLLQRERGVSALALVTGALTQAELLPIVQAARHRTRVTVIRVGGTGGGVESLPGARLVDVDGLDEFVAAWDRLAT